MDDSTDSSSSTNPMAQGCGPQQPHRPISIHISPTTGGDFHLTVEPDITVENLKKLVSKKLKVPRDRLCLLFRDKQLQDGNIVQHGIADGSKVTLLPNVETGLVTQRPEIGIMQALESLNDTQVNEFLCGKAPLNLSMRLGDHMMLIQLQLSTVSGAGATTPTTASTNSAGTSLAGSSSVTAAAAAAATAAAIAKLGTSNPAANGNPAHYPLPPPNTPTHCSASSPISSVSNPPTVTTANNSSRPPSLVQASRNLQHTLRRLSADVFGGGGSSGSNRTDESSRHRGGGSVYSGTFSGALNPALQDTKGRPRRDVATIVHILNDLLCSAPDLRRVGNAQQPCSGSSSITSPANPTSSTSTVASRRSTSSALVGDHHHHHHHHHHHPYSGLSGMSHSQTHTMETVTGCCVSPTTTRSPAISPTTSPLTSPMIHSSSLIANPMASTAITGSNSLSDTDQDSQNLRTRGKLEQLRLVMGERRERRQQRKRKPYELPGTGAGNSCAPDSVTA